MADGDSNKHLMWRVEMGRQNTVIGTQVARRSNEPTW